MVYDEYVPNTFLIRKKIFSLNFHFLHFSG